MTTPVHTFFEEQYKKNLELLHAIQLMSGGHILLAFKGYIPYHSALLTNRYLSGLAASSLFEARMARDFFELPIHTYCPGYINEDFDELASISDTIVFNSVQDLDNFYSRVPQGKNIDLRINLQHVIVDSQVYDGYNPNKPYSRFGVTLKELEGRSLDGVTGIHFHALNMQDSKDLAEMVNVLEDKFGWLLSMPQIKRLNMGGGHSITSPNYDINLLVDIIIRLTKKYNLEVYLEPSESVFYQVGTLEATVLSVVKNEIETLVLNVSAKNHMSDILESPYYIAQVKNADYEGGGKFTYILAGATCLSGDIIGKYSFDRKMNVGDKLIFLDQTQYTVTQSHFFNGVNKPSIEVIGLDGQVKFRKDYTYEDYKASL